MSDIASYYKGKTVLVTGGTSGIGLAAARLFASYGANVAIFARRGDRLKRVRKELAAAWPGGRFASYSLSVTNYSQVKKAVGQVEENLGPIDVVLNSAGAAYTDYFFDTPVRAFQQQMELNYLGTVHTAKAAGKYMVKRGRGHIVNVSSVAGFLGVFGFSAYSPTKFAVIGFSRALRAELKPAGVRVSVLCPPDVDTPGLKKENETKPIETKLISQSAALMTPDAVALYTARKLRAGRFMILPNLESRLIYFASGLCPWLPDLVMDRQIKSAQKQKKKKPRAES